MPRFFDISDVLDFHIEQIELYGGIHGVRDIGLLESALAVPMSGFGGKYLENIKYLEWHRDKIFKR